jgi:hypothetical protein
MTSLDLEARCCLCDHEATMSVEPSRRTLERGLDPGDTSYSVTVILPDIPLCTEHGADVQRGAVLIGWCDDERCRTFGEFGKESACGSPFTKLGSGRRS